MFFYERLGLAVVITHWSTPAPLKEKENSATRTHADLSVVTRIVNHTVRVCVRERDATIGRYELRTVDIVVLLCFHVRMVDLAHFVTLSSDQR